MALGDLQSRVLSGSGFVDCFIFVDFFVDCFIVLCVKVEGESSTETTLPTPSWWLVAVAFVEGVVG